MEIEDFFCVFYVVSIGFRWCTMQLFLVAKGRHVFCKWRAKKVFVYHLKLCFKTDFKRNMFISNISMCGRSFKMFSEDHVY